MTLESTIAGSWYPGTERDIRALVKKWDASASDNPASHEPPHNPNVLLLPHAGWVYSGELAWKAARLVREKKFRRAVVLAPSHRVWIENRLVAPEAQFVSTPLGKIEIDREWIDRFALTAPIMRNDKVHLAEHATQIEFPLLQLALKENFTLAPLIIGNMDKDQMAMCARAFQQLMDDQTLFVISSDFTHYGTDFTYTPYGKGGEEVRKRVAAVDGEAFELIAKNDADGFAALVKRTGATICGRVAIELALRSFPSGTSLSRLAYATSSDGSRDFSRFVCYTAAAGHANWQKSQTAVLDQETRHLLLRVARESITCAVRKEHNASYSLQITGNRNLPPAALARMGAFVTLNDRKTGALRGCIGEILPRRPLIDAVAERAVDAALHDPRFSPVLEHELYKLRVEVSALTPPRPVASWRDIVLGRDGMTLEKNGAFAVFLPQVAPEQGWDLPTTLSYLSRKAGLPADAWKDEAKFETFQAEVFHE
ncbi:MAG: AmmeMemoRadiSam system protein B [Kiritimatiellae bacterium]|nr:AmmeMemoRadiSam system protein B [Kiritimatiellia bacterium]